MDLPRSRIAGKSFAKSVALCFLVLIQSSIYPAALLNDPN